jgi:hypothetical protein
LRGEQEENCRGPENFVFVTIVVRAALSTMYAVAFQLRDAMTESCPHPCDECRNVSMCSLTFYTG